MASSAGFHEAEERLRPQTMDAHRAIVSLQEELEAVDWYDQRVDACTDDELRGILAHNRDEEREHASMVLEWLRRSDPTWEEHLRSYLFTVGPIVGVEAAATGSAGGAAAAGAAGSLGIGSLRGEEL